MQHKLYVGNLPYSFGNNDLQDHFQNFGDVLSAIVLQDRDSGRSKGFGFVEMNTADEAQAAIKGMNGKEFNGRALVVNEARPQEPRTSGFNNRRY